MREDKAMDSARMPQPLQQGDDVIIVESACLDYGCVYN